MAYSEGIYSHFQNACNGLVHRYKKGDYNYLAKLGGGLLFGFGCYKLYQRYDPHFFITDHIPHYVTKSMIPTITLSIMLRELSCSANAPPLDPERRSNISDNGQLPSRDSEVTFEEMMQLNEPATTHPPLKVSVERNPQNPPHETPTRAYGQPSIDPPATVNSRPIETNRNSNVGAGPSSHNQYPLPMPQNQQSQQQYRPQPYQQSQYLPQQLAPQYQPMAPQQQPVAPQYQPMPPHHQPVQQQSNRSTIHTGIVANRVKNLKITREGCTTTVKGHQGANVILDDELQDVGDAAITETNVKKTFE